MDSEFVTGWCPETLEAVHADLALREGLEDSGTAEFTHTCKYAYGHEPPHKCEGCGETWEMEVPC